METFLEKAQRKSIHFKLKIYTKPLKKQRNIINQPLFPPTIKGGTVLLTFSWAIN